MLSVSHLSATLSRSFKLDDVSFTVEPGERLAVLGPNGSGKSYMLRLLLGLETPDGGTVAWGDVVLSRAGRVTVRPEAREMGVVFQEGALFPHLDVRANVALALPRGLDRAARAERVDRALDLARIRHLASRAVPELSGGEQQRVAIARAIAHGPRTLLLDEPFHSLDGPLKRQVLADVRDLVRRERIATIFVTHDTDEAASFADRLLMLRRGRVVLDGTFASAYGAPPDLEAAELLGPVERLEASRAREASIALPVGGGDGVLWFRREHLALTEWAGLAGGGAEVVEVRPSAAYQDVTIRLADGGTVTARAARDVAWSVGQRVGARVTSTLAWPGDGERRE